MKIPLIEYIIIWKINKSISYGQFSIVIQNSFVLRQNLQGLANLESFIANFSGQLEKTDFEDVFIVNCK